MIGMALRFGEFARVGWDLYSRECMCVGIAAAFFCVLARRYNMPLFERVMDFIMVPLLIIGVWSIIKYIKLPFWCMRQTFAIFVLHGIFLYISIVCVVALQLKGIMGTSLMVWACRLIFATVCSILVSLMCKRVSPFLAYILFGGR